MGIPVIVYGKSGSGKSYSMKSFGKDEICLFNVLGKPLPFRGKFTSTASNVTDPALFYPHVEIRDRESVQKNGYLKKAYDKGFKTIVIDDAGYLMTSMFMDRHGERQGGSSFDLFNEIGDSFWKLLRHISDLPDDAIVYLMMHEESNDYGETKIRTIGKLLDQKVCIEGLCTIVIHAVCGATTHSFRVQSSGVDVAKAPEEMFDSNEIPNDLRMVDQTIREYYGLSKGAEKND